MLKIFCIKDIIGGLKMLIKTLNDKTIGIVVIPDGVSDLCLPKVGISDLYFHKEGEYLEEDSYISVAIEQGNWQILSLHSEMTEEKARMIMPSITFPNETLYLDYTIETADFPWSLETALESYQSCIKSLGYVTENPYGKEPKHKECTCSDCLQDNEIHIEEWEEAQEQVVELVILIKEG